MKLDVRAMALATGLIWGGGVFVITWWIILIEGSSSYTSLIGRVYIGHTFSPVGSLIGLVWGLVDGLIGGAVFAWLYNTLRKSQPAG